MADIAMLLAEEYERMIKKSKENGEEIKVFNKSGETTSWIKIGLGYNKKAIHIFNWVWEPKSQIGLAAASGFFSA